MRIGGVAATLLLLALAGAAQAKDADPVAVGRYHLRKANGLAGDDRCRAAIREYTLAYQKLHDPVVLFNRAECYRRIGEGDKAITDYRVFLDAVPAAPNRSQIEAKIAALNAPPAPVAAAPLARPAAPRPVAPAPARPTAATSPPPPARQVVPILDEPPPASFEAPPPVATLGRPGAAPPPPEAESHHGRAWIWVAVGAAVAGGAVGAYFALRPPATTPPVTDLGNYKF